MMKEDLDGVRFRINLDSLDGLRPLQEKELGEQIDVAHGWQSSMTMPMRTL